MQEITIVTKVDNQQAINAQVGLRKEIKNLKLELESLDKGTEEYINTSNLLIQKVDIYKEKMNSIKNSSSQFSDITINNTKILQGLGEGFKDATTNIELYIKAEGKLQSDLDKIIDASSSSNRLYNVKGSVDNSQEEALKRQAVAAEQANKALIGNSNTQAGLATATAATNNASSLQGNELIKNTTIVNENVVAQENLDRSLITATGSFREQLFEIKNDSAALAKLAEEKRLVYDYNRILIKGEEEIIATLQQEQQETKLFIDVFRELKKTMNSTDTSTTLFLSDSIIDKISNKLGKEIPKDVDLIKNKLNSLKDLNLDNLSSISIDDVKEEITKLDKSLKDVSIRINEHRISTKGLTKEQTELSGEIKKVVNAEDSLNERLKTKTDNTVKDNKSKVDASNASSELQKRNTMLAFSMAQIVREAPVATMSMDMFFLAISNNLPMLFDQVKAMKAYNKTLVENGKAGEKVNIWKALGKSLLSANSLMMIGVTLATMFGSKIIKWGKSLFYNVEALEKHKKAVEEQIAQNKELATSIGDLASKNLASFNSMKKEWDSLGGSVTKQRSFIKEYKDELKVLFGEGKITLQQYSDYFGKFSDEVINGYMLQAKAAAYMAAYQKIIAKQVSLELENVSWRVADFWETLQERFKTGFSGNWNETQKQKTEENRKEAKKQRAEDLQKSKDDGKRLLEQAGKNSDAAEKQFKELHIKNQKETKADGDTTIKYTTKTYEDLNKTFLDFKDKNSSIRRDWILSEELDNEKRYENLKRTQSGNYEALYVGTKNYLEMKQRLNDLKAQEELDKVNEDAKKLLDTQTANLENNIKAIDTNLLKGKGLTAKDRENEIALKAKYEDEKATLTDNYNTTILNNTDKFKASINENENENYTDSLKNTTDYYSNLIKEVDKNSEVLSNKTSIIFNDVKSNFANKQDVNLLSTLFNFNPNELEKQLAEITNKITEAQNNINNGTSKKDILDKELNDILTTAERRKEIEVELTNIEEEQSDARLSIAEAEAEKRKAINENIIAISESSMQATSSLFQSVIDNNDASYAEAENRYKQQLEDGLITKDQYDKKLLVAQQKQNEKNKKWQSGIAMIDGIGGAVKAFAGAMSLGPIAGPIVGGIQSAAIMASTVASIRKIYAETVSDSSSGGSGGSVSSASVASITAPLTYSTNVTTQSQEEQLNTPIKVYVLESDITNTQNKVKVVQNESTF